MRDLTFELKPEHLSLLSSTYINWNDGEFGAPEIDPKRPYGNSDVYRDIAEILDIKSDIINDWEESDFSDELRLKMWKLHQETATALEIVLQHLPSVLIGTYTSDKYIRKWKLVQEEHTEENCLCVNWGEN